VKQRKTIRLRTHDYRGAGAYFFTVVVEERAHAFGEPRRLESGSFGAIMGQFKSIITKRIRRGGLESFSWQRNYFEHVVRNDAALERIRVYIVNNALHWNTDAENPRRIEGRIDDLERSLEDERD
jgi:hypothetical protein